MIGGSYGVISKRFPEYSVGALLAVVVAQGMPYFARVVCSTLTAPPSHRRSRLRLDLRHVILPPKPLGYRRPSHGPLGLVAKE